MQQHLQEWERHVRVRSCRVHALHRVSQVIRGPGVYPGSHHLPLGLMGVLPLQTVLATAASVLQHGLLAEQDPPLTVGSRRGGFDVTQQERGC